MKNKEQDLHIKVELGKDGRAVDNVAGKKDEKSRNLMAKWLSKKKNSSPAQTVKREPKAEDEDGVKNKKAKKE